MCLPNLNKIDLIRYLHMCHIEIFLSISIYLHKFIYWHSPDVFDINSNIFISIFFISPYKRESLQRILQVHCDLYKILWITYTLIARPLFLTFLNHASKIFVYIQLLFYFHKILEQNN